HDAARFTYSSPALEGDLIAAYNQEESAQERYFGTDFSPDNFNNYKILLANYWKWKSSPKTILTAINAMDGFQAEAGKKGMYYRFTSGGRLEYTSAPVYFTLAGYYQFGETRS